MRRRVGSRLLLSASVLALCLSGCGSQTKATTAAGTETTTAAEIVTAQETTDAVEGQSEETKMDSALEGREKVDLSAYSLVWQDEFDADKLNTADWNYELHEPGWVNNELQRYVESDENIYLEDGKLVIKPIKIKNADGTVSYTSGRVNTMGKKDFTYGYFEASIKMPAGQGFLPAFWMMPTDENLYGQWPRCGEIDISEILGNETNKAYGTVHYGNPHAESQGTVTLNEGDFTTEFHKYAVEWLPGRLNWYIDDMLIHTENDWYSTTENIGTVTYPAPFDQPFYLILNLAVGGNWPGNPDDSTDFNKAAMEIDYVRVYQMDEYDENACEKPVKDMTLRDPDITGNYVNNGEFYMTESLSDDTDWKFLTAMEGLGTAEIVDDSIHITTKNPGTEDYGIQLVHWNVPMQKGSTYRITFDAWSTENRKAKVAVTAPERSWIRYFEDTSFDVTPERTTYTFDFMMTEEDDPQGRLEFNMGNQGSKADMYITNVRLEKTSEGNILLDGKTILGDGNYVSNSLFREGENRLGEWVFANEDAAGVKEVTSLKDGRRFHCDITEDAESKESAFAIGQEALAMGPAKYLLTFEAEGEEGKQILVNVNGEDVAFDMTGKMEVFRYEFECNGSDAAKNLYFQFPTAGEYYLDTVRLVEDVLIKNGSFNANMAGYEVYVDSSADASYVVDSQTEDNALDFTVNNTGDQDWKIQLKQNNIKIENGKTYTLKFDAKSSAPRKIRGLIQGGEDKGWPIYSGENTVELTTSWKTYTLTFTMEEPTDAAAFLSICLGQVDGESISGQHRVMIDNISLEVQE